MSNAPFTVDGVAYKVKVPDDGLTRNFEVMDGPNAGRIQTAAMIRDVLGTFYNYTLKIEPDGISPEEYDKLYDVLSAPVDSHRVSFPYGQSTLTFDAYVTNGSDNCTYISNGYKRWTGLSINFIAMKPQRSA